MRRIISWWALMLLVMPVFGTETVPTLTPTMNAEISPITDTPIEIKANPNPLPFTLFIPYSIEWRISLPDTYHVGLTPVGDTLLWVSEGGFSTADPAEVYVYNLLTLALIDSFNQPGVPANNWGWRDMTAQGDTVFASYDANVRVIHWPSRTVVRSFAPGTGLNPHRALAWNPGDSLYAANFASAIWQFYKTTPYGARSIANTDTSYGLAYDANGFVWMSVQTAAQQGKIARFSYPGLVKLDEQVIPEIIGLAGGCEMWRDTFLLYLNQGTPDEVVCLRLYFPTNVEENKANIFNNIRIQNPIRAPLILERVSKLAIYDILGKKINELESTADGKLIWHGKDRNNEPVPAGVYFLKIESEDGSFTRKAVLLR